ncbi:amidase signature enzyme [Gonapodya prolifera JEL478]|uniref:Amidase signature enzyme n=1 Tax=Gonapodya prolifera (strain JEL478) TaxID=1344416 RepID=A0A139AWC3_GONPJ|nr:amidase signature enzyme [Gonapodya prolifera JEL478]|eukprot:KXS21020.1 amidase signature enzyme [Gonapodya prolifera JEL478]
MEPNAGYNLRHLQAPIASGFSLRALTFLLETIGQQSGLAAFLTAPTGNFSLRGRSFEESPTLLPIVIDYPKSSEVAHYARVVNADSKGTVLPPQELLDLLLEYTNQTGAVDVGRKLVDTGSFAFYTARDYHDAYSKKQTNPIAVAERLVAHIKASNESYPALNSIVQYEPERILAQARASAERWAAGKPLSVLDGVPVTCKEEADIEGYERRVGTSFYARGQPSTSNNAALARLAAGGAIVLGATNMHEIGFDVSNINTDADHGPARNPYNVMHVTGGSSGGSASSVASGLAVISVGADGGGSLRIPASHCGVFTIKPTHSRIPALGWAPLDASTAHVGPIAATATDLLLGYAAMAGPHPEDAASQSLPSVRLPTLEAWRSVLDSGKGVLKGLCVGIFWNYFRDADVEYVNNAEKMVLEMARRGAEIVEVEIPDLEDFRVAHLLAIGSEITQEADAMLASARARNPNSNPSFSLPNRLNLAAQKACMTAADYVTSMKVRTRCIQRMKELFNKCDVFVLPTSGDVAPPVPEEGEKGGTGLSDLTTSAMCMRFAFLGNLSGIPAISVPTGQHPPFPAGKSRLPTGLQVLAPWYREDLLLLVAKACEGILEEGALKVELGKAPFEVEKEGSVKKVDRVEGEKVVRKRPDVWYDVLG